MSERERWVVYPLLFLTLGVSLRDKMIRPIADEVRCRQLAVYDKYDRKVAEIVPVEVTVPGTNTAAHAGHFKLIDPYGLPIVSVDYEGLNVFRDLDIIGPVNMPVVHIGASDSGGIVQVFHRRGDWNLALGQWDKLSGLLVQALGSQYQRVLVSASDPIEPLPEELDLEGLPPEPPLDEPPGAARNGDR